MATIQPSALKLFVDEVAGENALVDDPQKMRWTETLIGADPYFNVSN